MRCARVGKLFNVFCDYFSEVLVTLNKRSRIVLREWLWKEACRDGMQRLVV